MKRLYYAVFIILAMFSVFKVTYGDDLTQWIDLNGNVFEYGKITIEKPLGYSGTELDPDFFVVMDRNLGATSNNRDYTASYGYYYQWGNNYGFSSLIWNLPKTSEKAIYDSTYSHNGYYGTAFIVGNGYREDGLRHKELWGGENDSTENGWGLYLYNSDDRQGPCPEGWHIPSAGERSKAFEYRTVEHNNNEGYTIQFDQQITGLYYADDSQAIQFVRDVYIPSAGRYSRSRGRDDFGVFAEIHTSTLWYDFYKVDNMVGIRQLNNPQDGQSIRCFQNIYLINFNSDSGSGNFYRTIVGNTTGTRPEDPQKEGAIFMGWFIDSGTLQDEFDFKNTFITGNTTLYAKWGHEYTIKDWDGTIIETGIIAEGKNISISSKAPERAGYIFAGWDKSLENITESIEITATYTKKPSSGGYRLKKDNCPDGDYSDSYYDGECGENPQNDEKVLSGVNKESIESSEKKSVSEGQSNNELQTAYEFAYKNKITTMDTIEKADMEGSLTRIAMAKMLSKYAINVLGKKPANKVVPKFIDITEELNAEYDYGVSLAYQLGIMGINMPENKFRPFDLVPRSEFVTALSRMKYNMSDGEYEGTVKFYKNHMELLSKLGIVTVVDPDMKELRGYVMLMLMRSAK